MKYEELEKKIMLEIDLAIQSNKKLYSAGVKGVDDYDIELMKDISSWNCSDSLQSSDDFSEIAKTVDKMKDALSEHQVCKYSEANLEVEDNDYASFSYRLYIYEPIGSLSGLIDWEQKNILKNKIAKELGLHDHRFLKCEVMKLYKDDIITFEQLKQAHYGTC